MRLSTSRPFFNQISTLKQRRVPGGRYSYSIIAVSLVLELKGVFTFNCDVRSSAGSRVVKGDAINGILPVQISIHPRPMIRSAGRV